MMTDVEKNFYQLLEKLPKDLQNAISGVDTADAIESIAKKYSLLIDKMGILAEETGLVMLGITHPKDFISNLSQKLGVDRETARKIAEDINQQIFQKVRESLRKIHGIKEEAPSISSVSPVSPVSKPPPPLPAEALAKAGPSVSQPPKKEIPKEEIRPLEIRPMKSFAEETKKEIKLAEPVKPVPQLEKIKVMPVEKAAPPPNLPIADEKIKKKFDPYREPMK
ncbi:hypothetical protein A2757_03455 [Candidatus Giovannonibacteria bacterium RIFCSPHIGHO2_01_FULL_48_47]|nr:MAG: hypothetical protein A2757_03455 [Candidatus Giovannonibacteria bacterium RIFCSPHIGHO2_01_FULL_48_47]OGF68742.1 MAG: hypothetical protein A3D61_01470 [Candidatus Giovannonibacteria bacterium RIFCSPHIGHO2_02_FULL_48_15]HBT81760.1 hypothetical protein [Candidatus Giovannonibacteria bacterium]